MSYREQLIADGCDVSVDDFADAISARWQDSVVAIIDVGKLLLGAKHALPHGEFGPMVESDRVPFGLGTAQRLMAIAGHSLLSNTAHAPYLPSSWMTVYELTKAPDDTLDVWLADGTIHPEIQRHEVRRLLREARREAVAGEALELPEGKYRVIYADPPWKYGDTLVEGYGPADHHYEAMTISELEALDVRSIAADESVLFLWVTAPLISSSWSIIRAWGFEYKTMFVWDKVRHNFGHYSSVRHELLLVCTRGSCLPDSPKLHDSVVSLERSKTHSEKPEYFRNLIEEMYTEGRKVELFARRRVDGWDAHGNEL